MVQLHCQDVDPHHCLILQNFLTLLLKMEGKEQNLVITQNANALCVTVWD